MVSESAFVAIALFKNSLEQLHRTIISVPLDQTCLKQSFQQLKSIFKTEIMTISEGDFAPPVESLIQSYLTETHKQMRLLEMDLKFLQVSHQSSTFNTRLIPLQNRLNTLLDYCENILKLGKVTGL